VTAYELADRLDWHWDNDCKSPAVSQSADLLRRQADRIGVLEANHTIQVNIAEKQMQYIVELEKALMSSIALNKAQASRNGGSV